MHSSHLLQEAMTHVLVQPEKSLFFIALRLIRASLHLRLVMDVCTMPLFSSILIGKGLAIDRFFSA
jgi:hypothetical protein